MQGTELLNQAVANQPNGIATICAGRRRTWRQVGDRVPRLASALRGRGIANGAFVAALAMNSDRCIELFFAVPCAGGCFAPLNIRWSLAKNEYALTDSKSVVLFVDESFIDQARTLKQKLPCITTLIYMGEGEAPADMLNYETPIAEHAPMADANRCGEDLWVIFYTGGTTAHPKDVMMSDRGFATMLRWQDQITSGPKASRPRSAGQAAPGVEVRIMLPDGTIDEDGYAFVADRVKDMIVTGGENVYSSEVERALLSHPAVQEAAVIGIPSEQWGEAVHAVVVLRSGASVSAPELIAHCRGLIGGYKCPRSVEFRDQPLPITSVGKVRKNVLRDPYWAGRSKKI